MNQFSEMVHIALVLRIINNFSFPSVFWWKTPLRILLPVLWALSLGIMYKKLLKLMLPFNLHLTACLTTCFIPIALPLQACPLGHVKDDDEEYSYLPHPPTKQRHSGAFSWCWHQACEPDMAQVWQKLLRLYGSNQDMGTFSRIAVYFAQVSKFNSGPHTSCVAGLVTC